MNSLRTVASNLLTVGALLLVGCNAGGATTSAPGAGAPQGSSARRGGRPAFARVDTPYAEVAAEARRTGRPMLIYFWTSW